MAKPPSPEAPSTPVALVNPDLPLSAPPNGPAASSSSSNPAPSQELAPPVPAVADTELESVQTAVRNFRNELGENPIGTNAEITRSMLGDNLTQIKIPVPPGSQLNEQGELCDRWGTAYFFHQVSHSRMEIRSAGADRKMWTDDDLEVK